MHAFTRPAAGLAALSLALGLSAVAASADTVPRITRDELRARIERGDHFALFEVLPTMYWRKHHLPGARSLPPEQVTALVPQLVPEKDAEIVLYCWNYG